MAALITDSGLAAFVDALAAADLVKYLGWGGGSGQDVTDIDLSSAFAEPRSMGAITAASTNTSDDTYRVTGSVAATDVRAVTEVGLFSAASGGVMDVYGDFTAINLDIGDVISFTVDVLIDQA